MPNDESKRKWEQQLREGATHLEEDLRRFANGSEALRAAAAELHKLAQRMDDHARRTPPPPDAPKP